MSTDQRTELAVANRILANESVFRGLGHVSTRDPNTGDVYISRARRPENVTADDIMRLSTDGTVREGEPDSTYKEIAIHLAIYRAREDVNGIVHHHAQEIMPFTVSETEIEPVFRSGAVFHAGVPTFDDYDPEDGLLITGGAEAERMAQNLSDKRAQLLYAHGANVVGNDLKQAVVGTFYLIANARYQRWAELFGSPQYFTSPAATVQAMADISSSDSSVERMWEYLSARLPTAARGD